MQRVTLQTIADRVGVSRTTVSNAFSRPDQLNEELRRRILAVAEELRYPGPNPAARTLRRGRAGTLGVLFTEALSYAFADPYAVGFLRGLAEVAEGAGIGLHLIGWPSPDAAEEIVHDAVVDGFCLFSLPDGHPVVDAVARTRRRFVTVDEPYVPAAPFVGIDNRTAGRQVAGHLFGLGHRRVAVVHGLPVVAGAEGWAEVKVFGHIHARLAGYRDAYEAAGLRWADVPVYQASNERAAGIRAARRVFDASPRPTAVLATTDVIALGVLDVARERGLRVPEDVSVVGFDDIPEAAPAGLTTVNQPIVEKGRTAGRLLTEPPDTDPPRIVMPHELVVRTSTGPQTLT